MKLNKIFAIALAALTLTACSDDDDINTANVTVNMQKTEIEVSEDFSTGTYYYVPVEVTGESNGPVRVTVKVEGVGSTPATEGDDYVITSKTIVIPQGESVGEIEFHSVGDDIENPDREFTVTIVSAEGATIGSNATTIVRLLDNERLLPEAYAKMIGTWQSTTTRGSYVCTISGYPQDDPNYLKKLKLTGIGGLSYLGDVIVDFELDGSTGLINLSIAMPQVLATDIRFTDGTVADIVMLPMDSGGLYLSGTISATSNEECTQFVFDMGCAGGLFQPGNHTGGGFLGSVNFQAPSFNLTKVQ